ncbi:MAG TPA: helix-turn-helix transcriptional regulator [Coriobacteriia bacterium]|nr:helix-turn-helix transcriptional regulator [Coriobacteriia bacterium]
MSNRFLTKSGTERAGEALELVRVHRGYSLAEAAEAVGWSLDRLARVEAGQRHVTWVEALDLLTAIGAGFDDLTAAWSEAGKRQRGPAGQRTRARS